MARVLETLTVPRASGFPAASMSPIVSSAVYRLSARRSFVNLPESRGLKIQSSDSSGSVSLRSKLGRRGALIVCQAQEAVQVLMAFQQTPLFDSSGDTSLNKNAKSVSENSTGFCECNICLDSARDPVVTLCGHLYCWPCIYRWLHAETDKQPKCPVCKAHISNSSLVPLYGRGNTPPSNEPESELKPAHQLELIIPNRPPAPGGSVLHLNQQIHPVPFQTQPQHHPHPFGSYAFGSSNLGWPMTATSFSDPIVGMVGEMVCSMIFRSSDSGFFTAYPYGSYQNPYPVTGASSPRVRWQVMQVEKSLNRLTIFFFCCFILCFLLF